MVRCVRAWQLEVGLIKEDAVTRFISSRRGSLGFILLFALAAAMAIALWPQAKPAHAAFPGLNDRIACSGALATELGVPPTAPPGQSLLEIFTMNPDGRGQVRLQQNTNSDFNPRFSADGKKIVFIKDSQVWKMDADGSNEVQLTTAMNQAGTAGAQAFVGGWSPDGSKIVFQSNRDGNFEVYVMDADGSNEVNLTNNGPTPGQPATTGSDSQPAWSPDGTKIAFQSGRGGNPDIHVMDVDGSNVVNLTAGSAAEESAPSWSPDGKMIAFHSDRSVFPRTGARNLEIFRMDADGSNVVQLTDSDFETDPREGGTGSGTLNLTGFDLFPAWSPQGDRIVFHSGRAPEYRDTGATGIYGQWEAYTVDAVNGEGDDESGLTRLTKRPGNDERCDWAAIPLRTLTASKSGNGSGTILSAPAGIDCGTDCSEEVANDTQVTLVALPDQGSKFDGWTGACSGTGACTVVMSQARSVTAAFGLVPSGGGQTPPPEPTPSPSPSPTPPPSGGTQLLRPDLTASVSPARDLRRPFRFRVFGQLKRPSGVSAADGCQGAVRIRFRVGRRIIATRMAQVRPSCRYSQRFVFRNARWFGNKSRLRIVTRFMGNDSLRPRKTNDLSVRVRR